MHIGVLHRRGRLLLERRELTDESGTAPTVASAYRWRVTAGALAPAAAAPTTPVASSGLMYWNTLTTCVTPGTCAATSRRRRLHRA
jgi:hypothetical protein